MNTTNEEGKNTIKKVLTQNIGHILKGAKCKHFCPQFCKQNYKQKCRGMIFSLDALISFIIILTTILLFALTLNNYAKNIEENITNTELEEKAILIADSLVKNLNENNTTLGACIYDSEKKRVKTNEISSTNLKKAKTILFGKIFVKSIKYETQTRKEEIILSQKETTECINAKRFALIDGEKGIIFIKTCRER